MDLAELSLAQVAEAIRDGKVSASRAVGWCIDRIRRHDGSINAVVAIDEEGALRRAADADRMLASGRVSGPLHGVALAVGSSRVDLQACKLEYSIVSPK